MLGYKPGYHYFVAQSVLALARERFPVAHGAFGRAQPPLFPASPPRAGTTASSGSSLPYPPRWRSSHLPEEPVLTRSLSPGAEPARGPFRTALVGAGADRVVFTSLKNCFQNETKRGAADTAREPQGLDIGLLALHRNCASPV